MKLSQASLCSLVFLCMTFVSYQREAVAQAGSVWQARDCQTISDCYAMAIDKNQNKVRREEAIAKLARGGDDGLNALIRLLSASDANTVIPLSGKQFGIEVAPGFVRWTAAQTLGDMRRSAMPASTTLANLMVSDPSTDVRQASAIALGKMGSRDQSVVRALKGVLKSRDYYVWQGAAFAIGQLRPEDQEAVNLLRSLAHLTYQDVQSMRVDFNTSIAITNAVVEAKKALL